MAIIGLIGANVFSLVKYYSVADELEMLDDTQSVVQEIPENDIEGDEEDLDNLELDIEDSDVIDEETQESEILLEENEIGNDEEFSDLESNDEEGNDGEQENGEQLVDENKDQLVDENKNQEDNEDEENHGVADEDINNENLIQNEEEIGELFIDFNIEKTQTTLEIMSNTYSATIQGNSGTMNNFSWNDITIGDYVIMDRNLGATEPWDGTTFVQEYLPSYGYLYQWGNNYGFAPGETITNNSNRVTVALLFIPSMYSSSTFVKQNNTNWNNDVTATDALWGYGAQYLFDRDRQGPCPDGYHVPSKSEWDGLFNYWKIWPDRSTSEANKQKNFVKDLLLPAAGYIDGSNVTFKFNATANYFSSTPNNATQAYTLTYDSGNGNDPKTEGKGRSNGRSVRCFKNTNEAYRVIFTSVNGLAASTQSVAKGGTSYAIRPADPIRSNSEFIGWFLPGSSTVFDFENTPITEDTTLYAKWNCKYGLVESDDGKYCEGETTITFDANGGKFSDGVTQKTATYIIDENQFISDLNIKILSKEPEGETGYMFDGWYTTGLDARWTGYIVETLYAKYKPFKDLKLNYSGVEIIIMDRNLGATEAGTGCSDVNSGACGYQYERGNNYGFAYIPINGNKQFPNGERIIGKAADDWTGKISTYYSSLFRSVYPWNSGATTLDNLWGGENSLNFDETKQGPCPNGYHVPNYSERYSLYNLRKSVYSGDDNNQSNTLSNELLLPFAGWRKASDGKIQSVGILGGYRSSSSDSARISRGILLNLGNEIGIPHGGGKSDPLSVRCFKNTGKPIQFETNGGTLNTEIEVNKRWWEDAIELDVPTKENYYFGGWYTTSNFQSGTKVETNDIDTVDDTVKLYAKWNDLVVNFDTNRGTYINSQTAASGDIVNKPEDPLFPGYTFEGWYADEDFTTEFNFSTPITGNTTIYAKWSDYIYSFDDLELYFIDSTGNLSHYTIMDRNLGATEVYNQNYDRNTINTGSFGYHYQWGNNYGFMQCNSLSGNCHDLIEDKINLKIESGIRNIYVPSMYAVNIRSTSKNWMLGSTTRDNIWGGGSDNDLINGDGSLIGDDNDWNVLSGRQGPCPNFYYIPSIYDWYILKNDWQNTTLSSGSGVQFSNDFLLPPASSRHYNDTVFGSFYGYYWSSSPSSINADQSNGIKFDPDVKIGGTDRGYGRAVRCAKSSPNNTSFTIHTNGGKNATIIFTGNVGEGRFTTLSEPVRNSGTFGGWYSDKNYQNQVHTGDIVSSNLYAKWNCDTGYVDDGEKCVEKKTDESGNKSSGGGKRTSSDKSETKNSNKSETHNSAESTTQNETKQDGNSQSWNNNYSNLDIERYNVNYSTEQNEAYQFAYANGVTTMSTIQTANMNGKLTRIQMAKMLSNYAINVLGKKPDTSKTVKFNDVSNKLNAQYDNGVMLAYQLGIMGINMKNNNFRPNDEVTRAEFATALSRLLYSTPEGNYESTIKYYKPHIAKLYNEGIITNTDSSMKEKRGYVMLMLMRSAK